MTRPPAAGHAFPRARRLLAPAEFDHVFASGRKLRVGSFEAVYCPNPYGWARLGLAVPKRRVRRATARSRLKRIVRESFRLTASSLPAIDVVILPALGSERRHARALNTDLETLWLRCR